MTGVELVKISSEAMKMMSNSGIKADDWQYIPMFEEYQDMRRRREKFRYIIAHLSDVYHISESSVKRIIKRLEREVIP